MVGKLEGISDKDIDAAIEELKRRRAEREKAGLGIGDGRSDSAEAAKLATEALEASQVQRWNAHNNAILRRRANAIQDSLKGQAKVYSFFHGTNTNYGVKGSRESFEAKWHDLNRRLAAGFYYDIEKAGLVDYLRTHNSDGSGILDDLIAKETDELRPGGTPGSTGSEEARKIASILAKYNEMSRQLQNLNGAFIRKAPAYLMIQRHDPLRIRAVAARQWADDIIDLLDDKNFEEMADVDEKVTDPRERRIRSLMRTHDKLASGRFEPEVADDPALEGFKGPANLARKISHSRVFYFKNAEAFIKYNKKYGSQSLMEGFLAGIEKAAQNVALLQTFGTNPRVEVKRLYGRAYDQLIAAGDVKAAEEFRPGNFDHSTTAKLMDIADGSADVPGNMGWARIGSAVRSVQSWSSLGGAAISAAFGDASNIFTTLSHNGKNFFESIGQHYSSVLAQMAGGGARDKRLAALTGVAADTALHNISTRFDAYGDYSHRKIKSFSNLYFKLNLLTGITRINERSMEAMLATELGMAASKSMSDIDVDMATTLQSYGITPEMWDVLRAHIVEDVMGQPAMIPAKVIGIPSEAMQPIVKQMGYSGKEFSARMTARARSELQSLIGGYLASETYNGVIRVGMRERQLITQGQRPGTFLGEGVRQVAQFKGYPLAVVTRILGRLTHEDKLMRILGKTLAGIGSFGYTLPKGEGSLFASYIVAMTGLGYVSLLAADTLRGLTPRDPRDPKTALAAMLRGGGLGLYGDYLFGQYEHFGAGLLDQMAGPTLSDASRLYGIYLKGSRWIEDQEDFPDTEISNLFTQNTPGINLFYTRAAMNYLILYDLQEALSPGVLRRIENRALEERGQRFYLSPRDERVRLFTE